MLNKMFGNSSVGDSSYQTSEDIKGVTFTQVKIPKIYPHYQSPYVPQSVLQLQMNIEAQDEKVPSGGGMGGKIFFRKLLHCMFFCSFAFVVSLFVLCVSVCHVRQTLTSSEDELQLSFD